MKLIPRDYQLAAHQATWNYIHAYPDKNPLVVEPTGTGKSMQMAMLIWHVTTAYPSARIISLAHVKELIESNYNELMGIHPTANAGIYSSGLKRRDYSNQIIFAGIQSVADKAPLFKKINIVLVDEAHTISDNDKARYNKFLNGLREKNPKLIVIGYTATDFRTKSGKLTEGELFDEVCYDLSSGEAFVWLIEQGYLTRPVPRYPGFQLNSDSVRIKRGEFDPKQASEAMRDQNILERAVNQMIKIGEAQNRKAWLHFCQSIEDAELVADMFTMKGYPHEAVHSKSGNRDDILERFRRGELRGVTNKDILTTGYNQKNIDLIGALRLTRSPGLWVQIVGRGTRPDYVGHIGHNGGPPLYDITTQEGRLASIAASDKQTCLVMDFVGNTERLGPINYPNVPKKREKGSGNGDMSRMCPECNTFNHISVKICEECGYEFPPPERIKTAASDAELVTTQKIDLTKQPPPPEEHVFGVELMVCSKHEGKYRKKEGSAFKEKKPDTLKASYSCAGYRQFSTWVGFDHPDNSFPRKDAERWWYKHGGEHPVPRNVAEAVDRSEELNKPKFIKVRFAKFDEVIDYDFRGTAFELPPEAGGPPLRKDPLEYTTPAGAGGHYNDDDDSIPF